MLVFRNQIVTVARFVCAAILVAIAFAPIGVRAQSPELWAAQTSPTTVVLTWKSVPASNFQVHARVLTATSAADDAPLPLRGVVAGNKTSFVLGIPLNATRVRASLKVVDAAGRLSPEIAFNDLVITQSQSRPAAPATVTVRESGPGKLTLEWAPVPGATAYYLARSVAPYGFTALCQICSTATQYTDSAVTPGARHIYTVGAYSAAGMGARTNSPSVTPSGSGISSTLGSGTTGTGSTSSGTGIGSTSGGGPTGILGTGATGDTTGGLGIGGTTGGTGTGGTFGSGGTSLIPPLATPAGLKAVISRTGAITLTWSAAPRATSYQIIKDDGTRRTINVPGNVLQYYDAGSVKLTRRYWIQAVNSEGMSAAVAFPAPVPEPKG